MGWHYLEPAPRAYQGQAWEHVVEDNPPATAGQNLSLYALIDVRPHSHDDHTIRPMIGRQDVERLAAKLAGTLYGISRPARTIDTNVDQAADVMRRLAVIGVDMDDVGLTLETQGVAAFHTSHLDVLAALTAKADQLSRR